MNRVVNMGDIKVRSRVRRTTALRAAFFGLGVMLVALEGWAANVLRDISFSSLPDRGVEIILEADHPILESSSFSTQNPSRIAVDLPEMTNGLAQKTRSVGVGMVRSITAVEGQGRTRVVINMVENMPYQFSVDGSRALLRLGGAAQPLAPALTNPAPQTTGSNVATQGDMGVHPAMARPAGRSLESVDFRRGQEGSGRVVFMLTDPSTVVDLYEDTGQVSLDFRDTKVPENLLRKFDVADFGTPVTAFEVSERKGGVHVRFSSGENYEYLAYQTDNEFTVEFRALTKEEKDALKKEKIGYTGERLSLNFQDIEVRAVLQLLGDFTGKNMVVADSVTGNITLRLKNVPWDQAMDLILKTRGLDKRVDDNIILIAPATELAAQEEQKLASQMKIEELAPLHSEFFQINYAKVEDIASLLKSEENQLLTPDRGNVTFDSRTNMLLVRDTASKLEDLQRLITRLDVPVQQVLIESRVVVASDSFTRDIGTRLGFSRANRLSGTDVLIGGGLPGGLDGSADYDVGLMGANLAGMQFPAMISEGTSQGLMVNLPGAAVGGTGGVLNMLIGNVGSYLLQLELSAMQTEGKGEVLSSPRLITADKEQAKITQGYKIPYQSVDNGQVSTNFENAQLSMDVTPLITPDDRVILEINVEKSEPDFANTIGGQPGITTRTLETNVLVDNGATVVLGGIFEKSQTESYELVPFFGELPVVGNLFKHRSRSVSNSELLIFVTPKILKEDLTMK